MSHNLANYLSLATMVPLACGAILGSAIHEEREGLFVCNSTLENGGPVNMTEKQKLWNNQTHKFIDNPCLVSREGPLRCEMITIHSYMHFYNALIYAAVTCVVSWLAGWLLITLLENQRKERKVGLIAKHLQVTSRGAQPYQELTELTELTKLTELKEFKELKELKGGGEGTARLERGGKDGEEAEPKELRQDATNPMQDAAVEINPVPKPLSEYGKPSTICQSMCSLTADFWLFAVMHYCSSSANHVFASVASSFLTAKFGYNPTDAGLSSANVYILGVFLSPFIGRVLDSIGCRLYLLAAGALLTALVYFALAFSFVNPTAMVILLSVTNAAAPTALRSTVPLLVHRTAVGTAFGIFGVAEGGAVVVGNMVTAKLISTFGFDAGICFLCLLCVIQLGVSLLLIYRNPGLNKRLTAPIPETPHGHRSR
jgi:hypothetical protein